MDLYDFFKYAMKAVASEGCAEICCELGSFYMEAGDYDEAIIWLYNAAYETESVLNIHSGGDLPLRGLAACYQALGTGGGIYPAGVGMAYIRKDKAT